MMIDENLFRQRQRLASSQPALKALDRMGITSVTIENFDLGLKAPYISRKSGTSINDALSFPVRGADGETCGRYAYFSLARVTAGAPNESGWGVGSPLTYWSEAVRTSPLLVIAPDPKTLWLLHQVLTVTEQTPPVIITPSHPGPLPQEWSSRSFWTFCERVVVMSSPKDQKWVPLMLDWSDCPILVCDVPSGYDNWAEALKVGMSAADLMARIAQATSLVQEDANQTDAEAQPGLYAYEPVDVGGAYRGGHLYYPYKVEERQLVSLSKGKGVRRTIAHSCTTKVLRSDGETLDIVLLPGAPGSAPTERLLALSDGTRLTREPVVPAFASWSFGSIKRYSDLLQSKPEQLHRPLDLITADLELHLRSRVWLPNDQDYALAVAYILFSYVFQIFSVAPLMLVHGPKGSGKSELGSAMAEVSCNGVVVGQASAAGIVRLMDETRGLLIIDDLERIGAASGAFADVTQMLKIGYKRATARKPIVDRAGKVVQLNFFGPKLITNTRGVDSILLSRMLTITTAPCPKEAEDAMAAAIPLAIEPGLLRDELHSWAMLRAQDVDLR